MTTACHNRLYESKDAPRSLSGAGTRDRHEDRPIDAGRGTLFRYGGDRHVDCLDRDLSGLTDEDLFVLMAQRAAVQLSRQAFEELYRRHAAYLYGALKWVAPAIAYGKEDLLQDTFVRAFERAANFKPSGLDVAAARRRARAYLARIADRLVKENLPRDREGFVRLVHLTQECWQEIAGTNSTRTAGVQAVRVREQLRELKPRDREVLLLYMQWYDPDLRKQRIPDEIVNQLCAHYGIERANFRQIVSRSLRRMEDALRDVPAEQSEQ